jgi:hypothetical protein
MSSGNVVRRASQNAGMIDRARAIPDRLFAGDLDGVDFDGILNV